MHYETLLDAETDFIDACEDETNALFRQSFVCADAVASFPGAKPGEILEQLGKASGRGRATMYNRLRVGQRWRKADILPGLTWYHYLMALGAGDVSPNGTYNQKSPDLWLAHANDNALSVRDMEGMINEAKHKYDNPQEQPPEENFIEPVLWLKNAPLSVESIERDTITLKGKFSAWRFDDTGEVISLEPGARVVVTVSGYPQAEQKAKTKAV
jgi:hypothetical protein